MVGKICGGWEVESLGKGIDNFFSWGGGGGGGGGGST